MHRSTSTTRTSEEFYMAAQAMGGSYQAGGLRSSSDMDHLLPTYDPQSEVAKKEANRAKVAENLVHVIPFVLVICTIILWFFSHPATDIDVMGKASTAIGKLKSTPANTHDKNWNNGSSMTSIDKARFDGGRGKGKKSKNKNKGSSHSS